MLPDAVPVENRVQILVVDDQPAMAGALACFVRALGYEARVASSGDEALTRIFQEPPSLVLLDLNLDGSDGGDVLRALRADPRFANLPVVLCSAQDRLRTDDLRQLGAQDFVQKSEVFERLGEVIETQLKAIKL